MHKLAYVITLILAVAAMFASAATPTRMIRTIDTRELAELPLRLLRQETIDLRLKVTNFGDPVDLTGWTVVLHGRTNGQSAVESYQVPGITGTASDPEAAASGWMSAQVDVDAWWPAAADAGTWALVATAPESTVRLMRAGGPLTVRGTAAADAQAPLPQSIVDTLATKADLVAASNALAAAISSGGGVSGDYLPLAGGTMNEAAVAIFPGSGTASTRVGPYATVVADGYGLSGTLTTRNLTFAYPFGGSAYSYTDDGINVISPSGSWTWLLPGDEPTGERNHASREWVQGTLATFDPPDTDAKIAAATNAIIQTYLITSNSWMSISNATLSIYAPTGSAMTASLVWASAESSGASIDPAATNLLWQALSSAVGTIATKAPKAWGQYAPDGSDNPDPGFMTFLNSPATVLSGGSTWATSGAFSVLVAAGTVAFSAGSSGELRIGPDLSTNWFGYRQGGSYVIGARANSISTHDGGTTNGFATIVYDFDGGNFPVMWFTPLLGLDFVLIDTVWVDNQDGSATVTVPAQAARGFYRATTTANIDSLFVSTMPAVFEGGVIGGTNATPVIYDSTITVTSGGKTYRIPAQEIK